MCNGLKENWRLARWRTSANESSGSGAHLERCEECRGRVAAYKQVTETFTAYCDAVMQSKTQPRVPRWVPVLAAAIVFAACCFLCSRGCGLHRRRFLLQLSRPPMLLRRFQPAAAPDATPRKTVH